jgi:hypothetical protein
MVIGELALWEKIGGKSGHWRRPQGALGAPLVNTPSGPPPAVSGDSGLAAIDAVLEEGPLGQ